MALFKILKGQKADLPATKHEGYAYVTADEHKMYIDITDANRIALNSDMADRIPYAVNGENAVAYNKTITTTDPFELKTGALIAIKFTSEDPGGTEEEDNIITFNVNNTGRKQVYYRGARIPNEFIASKKTYLFLYNGTQYELVGDVVPYLGRNKTVITDGNGMLSSRPFADAYVIAATLPTTNINNNVVYLVPTGESGTGSGGSSASSTTYGLSRSGFDVTLTGSDGTTNSVEATTRTQVQDLIDATITTALNTAYPTA